MTYYRFNLRQMMRAKVEMFWGCVFPLLLSVLFYISFGMDSDALERMEEIPAGLICRGNAVFEAFLEFFQGEGMQLAVMEEERALEALENGEVKGIFYSSEIPSLTVAEKGVEESILEGFLQGYLEGSRMLEQVRKREPGELFDTVRILSDTGSLIASTDPGGNTLDNSFAYFFALIAMACLFGSYMGMTAASNLRADQSALAARRSIIPVPRSAMVLSEMMAAFTLQFINCLLLLLFLRFGLGILLGERWYLYLPVCALGCITGVSSGIFVGTLKMGEGVKTGLLTAVSLTLSFLSGLMFGNMKDLIEHHAPVLNRLNPAALISDALYSVSVYENPVRYARSLVLLAGISALLLLGACRRMRRMRYDSI